MFLFYFICVVTQTRKFQIIITSAADHILFKNEANGTKQERSLVNLKKSVETYTYV